VVATPIGNLEDITLRALRVLREVSLVMTEDTRTTRKLLDRYEVRVPMLSFFEGNVRRRTSHVLAELEAGHDVALVTEAGTPGVSDPGAELARAAAEAGCPVVPIPGPSAVATLLSVAGMDADRFTFLGFLPKKAGERRRLLESVAGHPWPLVLYESPYRVRATLEALLETLGDRELVAGREMTKLHEQVWRGTVNAALEHFTNPRGEFTLAVAGTEKGKRREKKPKYGAGTRLSGHGREDDPGPSD
jgi:16S rRNA (cytidine1402-2'-O)-methyltransferase